MYQSWASACIIWQCLRVSDLSFWLSTHASAFACLHKCNLHIQLEHDRSVNMQQALLLYTTGRYLRIAHLLHRYGPLYGLLIFITDFLDDLVWAREKEKKFEKRSNDSRSSSSRPDAQHTVLLISNNPNF